MLIKNKMSYSVIQKAFAESTFIGALLALLPCSFFDVDIVTHLTNEYASRIILFTQYKRAGGFLPSPYTSIKDGDLRGKYSHS